MSKIYFPSPVAEMKNIHLFTPAVDLDPGYFGHLFTPAVDLDPGHFGQ